LALLAVGLAGALAGQASGLPAGTIVGALCASGLYVLAGGGVDPWRGRYGRAGRLLLGTIVGAAFGPDVIGPLKATLWPATVMIVAIIGVGLALGWILSHLSKLDSATAIISALPGGLPAMAAMAEDVEADAIVVATIHFLRLATILVTIPIIIGLLARTQPTAMTAAAPTPAIGLGSTLIALALGLGGGLLALRANIPTGDLVGPILVVGGINLLGAGLGPIPDSVRQAAMLFIGISVGAQLTRESLRKLWKAALPAVAVVATLIGAGLLLGWVLSQVTPLDLTTALLSCVPGGASLMPIIAHDLGADIRLVAALQLARQLVMIILVPSVLGYLLRSRHRSRSAATMDRPWRIDQPTKS
jgi:membrane AbrB-like protein